MKLFSRAAQNEMMRTADFQNFSNHDEFPYGQVAIHISYGTVVRDFESEAKTRCNFQFR